MNVTEHVEQLLRRGRKPKELQELGFPKRVITRVRRQLRREKAALPGRTSRDGYSANGSPEPSAISDVGVATMHQKLASLGNKQTEFEGRLQALEAIGLSLKALQTRLSGTPALGLKHRFTCDCGSSGLLALLIRCTKCDCETWWGWWPQE